MTFEMPTPQGGGNGYPVFKWSKIGDILKGGITNDPTLINRKDLNGDPTDYLVFEVHSDEELTSTSPTTGKQTTGEDWGVWLKIASQQYGAVYDAVQESGSRLMKGGRIAIKLSELEDRGKPSPMKKYTASYKCDLPVSEGRAVEDLL